LSDVHVCAAFLSVRAHVSFGASTSAPIDFRRGDRPPVGEQDLQKRSAGDSMASTSGLRSRLRSASPAAALGRRSDPALGLASCRVVGHFSVHRPGSTPVPIIRHRNIVGKSFAADIPIRSWAWRRSFPSRTTEDRTRDASHVPESIRDCEVLSLRGSVAALQRLDGADACPT
jgi:hypothetical protein